MSSIPAALQPFLGTWRLDPYESRYEWGKPPLDGAYVLAYDSLHLHFDIEWTDPDVRTQHQAVDAVVDGRQHPYAGPGVDSVCYTLVDEQTLDSTASQAGQVIGHARRLLQAGGEQMQIVQTGSRPGGVQFANRSLYRRADRGDQAILLLLERFNRALNAHNVDRMMALMSDDCVFENTYPPPDGERLLGQVALKEFWKQFFANAPAARLRIEELAPAGDRAFQRWIYDWGSGYIRGVDIFRIENGKIAEKLSYVKG